MMGEQKSERELFNYAVNLEKRVRSNHPLRRVAEEIDRLAHDYLSRTPLEAKGLGILHRCGSDFYFLIVNTWRGNNEVWETVFYKDGAAMADFAPFPREGMHKPTFCVWELAPVWSRDGGRSDFSSQHGMAPPRKLGRAIAMPETHE
jgi:hypothetical protein